MGHPVRFTERGRQTFQGSETAPKAAYFELSEIMTGGSYERTEGTWAGSPAMEEGGVEVRQWRRIVGWTTIQLPKHGSSAKKCRWCKELIN